MAIPESDLNKLISQAGIGERTAKKLRAANKPKTDGGSSTTVSPRGHGAPAPMTTRVRTF